MADYHAEGDYHLGTGDFRLYGVLRGVLTGSRQMVTRYYYFVNYG